MKDAKGGIPDKLYFRIGEVSQLVGVEPYVLRYWESEFPGLSPKKSETGQRMFRRKDVELLLRIKQLLYEQKFTIEGARKALQKGPERTSPLAEIRHQLHEILKLVTEPTVGPSSRSDRRSD